MTKELLTELEEAMITTGVLIKRHDMEQLMYHLHDTQVIYRKIDEVLRAKDLSLKEIGSCIKKMLYLTLFGVYLIMLLLRHLLSIIKERIH